jgi:hypothetical protein
MSSALPPIFEKVAVRSDDDCKQAEPQVPRATRMQAKLKSSKEYVHISEKAQAGTGEAKLSMIDYAKIGVNSQDDSLFESNVEVETFVNNFERHCINYDMVAFLHNFPLLDPPTPGVDESTRFQSGNTINLLDKWDRIGENKDITLDEIARTTHWIKTYTSKGSQSYLDDMAWTHNYLLNSMDTELRSAVVSMNKHQFKQEEEGGPLTFAIMIDKCINLSEEAIESLKKSIEKYDIKNTKGEDISAVCSRFRYALRRLESNDALTPSLIRSLFKVFQTSSVPEFNEFVAHWGRDISRRGATKPVFTDILNEVEDFYKRLLASGEWCGVGPKDQDSAFTGEVQDNQSGRSSGEKPDYSPPTDKDKVSDHPLRYERMIKGRLFKYCAKCSRKQRWNNKEVMGRWVTSHYTDGHTGKPRTPKEAPSANLADTTKVTFAESLAQAQNESN